MVPSDEAVHDIYGETIGVPAYILRLFDDVYALLADRMHVAVYAFNVYEPIRRVGAATWSSASLQAKSTLELLLPQLQLSPLLNLSIPFVSQGVNPRSPRTSTASTLDLLHYASLPTPIRPVTLTNEYPKLFFQLETVLGSSQLRLCTSDGDACALYDYRERLCALDTGKVCIHPQLVTLAERLRDL